MPVFNNALAGAAGSGGADSGYQIDRSLRFNSGDSSNLQKQFSSSGNTKKWTWSAWVKFNNNSGTQVILNCANGNNFHSLYLNSNGTLKWDDVIGGSDVQLNKITDQVFRDFSAWYHIVLVVDTTQATAANRNRMYVNGVQATFASGNNFAQNDNSQFNQGSPFTNNIGSGLSAASPLNAYLAEVNFIDGQALAPTDFGEFDATTGVWNPIEFTGNHGPTPVSYSDNSQTDLIDGNVYLSTQPVENIFDGDDTTYSRINRGTNTNPRATFIWEPTGGISGVTKIRIKYDYCSRYQINNGTWANVNNNGGYQEIYNGSAFTLTTLKIQRTDASGSDFGIFVYGIEINDTLISNTGNNGFHLDFSDNSSDSALGNDAAGSNNWTVNNLFASSSLVTDGNDYQAGWAGPSLYWASTDSWSNLTVQQDNQPLAKHKWDTAETLSNNHTFAVGDFRQAPANGSGGFVLRATTTVTLKFEIPGSYITEIAVTDTDAQTWGNRTVVATNPSQGDFVTATGKCFWWSTTSALPNVGGMGTVYDSDAADVDSLLDSPTNYEADSGNNGGNYATLNPINSPNNASGSLSEGNLKLQGHSSGWGANTATIAYPSSGKWYYEAQISGDATTKGSNSQYTVVGVTKANVQYSSSDITNNMLWIGDNGYGRNFSSSGTVDITPGARVHQGSIVGVAIDTSANTFEFFVDGVSKQTGTINVTAGTTLVPLVGSYQTSQTHVVVNFGQRPFAYTPPTGFKSLCTQNLDDPLIADPSTAFDVKTWQGDGVNSARTISGFKFSPDLVWGKTRTAAYRHMLYDTVRGVGKDLRSDTTAAEGTNDQYGYLSAFNSDGFTTSSGSTDNDHWNHQTKNYVAWSWDAGSSNTSISVGGLNSSVYDQSQNWTNNVSSTSNITSGHEARLFNGILSGTNADIQSTQGTSGVINFTSAITGSKIEIYTIGNVGQIGINGSNLSVTANQWVDTGVTSLTSVETRHPGAGSIQNPTGLKVDGKILVDSGLSVTNVPSIATTNRANQTAGFSISTYTGNGSANQTLGHGLGASPSFVLIKDRSSSQNWAVLHTSAGTLGTLDGGTNYKLLELNANVAARDASYNTIWHPTSTTVKIGEGASSAHWTNKTGDDYVMYAWTPVEGYSAFGSYTGNGSADGPFVYTGFKTRWLMIKSSSNSGEDWLILDTARDTYNNGDSSSLYASLSHADNSTTMITTDILSNGFKPRATNAAINASGYTYIYAAFAENPFKTARAR